MGQRYLTKTRKILQRSFCSRFYERLSSFCYGKLRENYLSPSRKIIFLFLLMLCAEITLSLGAPVSRSVRINFPYTITLNITEHSPKLFFLGKNCAHPAAFFVGALRYSSLAPQAHSYSSVISASVQAAIFTLFASFTQLLIRDDRIIVDTDIKLSPIKAQGPPFFEQLFTAHCLVSCPPQYLYYCVISTIFQKESHSSFASILAIFSIVNIQFLNPKTEKYFVSAFLIFSIFGFLKKGGGKNIFNLKWQMRDIIVVRKFGRPMR